MPPRFPRLTLGLCLLLAAPAFAADVEQVMNPADPPEADRTIEPELLWHLGADEDAPIEELFGFVTEILVDEQGNSYLLDMQLNEIRVFDRGGAYVRTLGRDGEGPGEFRNARQIFFLPGDRLGVAQMMPSRVAVMDLEGNGYADLPLPGEAAMMRMVENVRSVGDRLVLAMIVPAIGGEKPEIRKSLLAMNDQGEELASYRKISEPIQGGRMAITLGGGSGDDYSGNWDIDAAGRVYTAPMGEEYLIRVYAPEGELSREIHREYETRKRTREEIAELEALNEGLPHGAVTAEVDTHDRDINQLIVRPDGSLWVVSSRNSVEGREGFAGPYDRFDADGRLTHRLHLKVDYDPERDAVRVVGDRLYVIKEVTGSGASFSSGGGGHNMMIRIGGGDDDEEEEGEAAPLSVICYRLPDGL